jgi:hypothetical protein
MIFTRTGARVASRYGRTIRGPLRTSGGRRHGESGTKLTSYRCSGELAVAQAIRDPGGAAEYSGSAVTEVRSPSPDLKSQPVRCRHRSSRWDSGLGCCGLALDNLEPMTSGMPRSWRARSNSRRSQQHPEIAVTARADSLGVPDPSPPARLDPPVRGGPTVPGWPPPEARNATARVRKAAGVSPPSAVGRW